jgi:hypothetical protein
MAEIQLEPGEPFNIEVRQGETHPGLQITEYQDAAGTIPLSNVGFAAKMQIRKSKGDDEVIVELTDGDGITLGGVAGTIDITIDSAKTALLSDGYVYDLRLKNTATPPVVRYPIDGNIVVDRRVTRDD